MTIETKLKLVLQYEKIAKSNPCAMNKDNLSYAIRDLKLAVNKIELNNR
jgi:hypothetical protein